MQPTVVAWCLYPLKIGTLRNEKQQSIHHQVVLVSLFNQVRANLMIMWPIHWMVVWNHGILNDFPIILLGMSSSQLTFIFFRGADTTNQIHFRDVFLIIIFHFIYAMSSFPLTHTVFFKMVIAPPSRLKK